MNNIESKTILLVEDEAIIALVTSKIIQSFGYNVLKAGTGERAIEIAVSNNDISLILIDINLGVGIDGTEAARQILASRNIPIVFLTSHSESKMVEKVRGITRYGYVTKNSGDFVLQSSIEMAYELFESHCKSEAGMNALMESEERYRLLYENAGAGIGYYKSDGTIITYNRIAASQMNAHPEDFKGKSIYNVFPRKEAELYYNRIKKAADSDVSIVYEDLIPMPTGRKYFLSTFTRIMDLNNNISGIQVISQDITGQKLTEENLRTHQIELEMQNDELRRKHEEFDTLKAKYFEMYDLAPVSYITLSDEGVILEANLIAANLFGLARKELIGKLFNSFIYKEDQEIYYFFSKKLSGTHPAGSVRTELKQDGSDVYSDVQTSELKMKHPDGTIFSATLIGTGSKNVDGVFVRRIVVVKTF